MHYQQAKPRAQLGRDWVPNYWTRAEFDPFGQNGVGSTAGARS